MRNEPGPWSWPFTSTLMAGTLVAGLLLLLAAGPLRAAEIYRVDGVPVDATAASAVAARDIAIDQGERDGLRLLMRRLTSPDHADRLPDVATVPIDRFVNSYEVAEERLGPTRYVAKLNISYVATEVQDLLRGAGLPFVERRSDPILVVPVEAATPEPVAWDDGNAWRQAWLAGLDQATVAVLVLPLADLSDMSTAPAPALLAGNAAALNALAARYGAGRLVVASARLERAPGGGAVERVDVTARDSHAWNPPLLQRQVAAEPGEDEARLLARAVGLTVAAIEDGWKRDTLTRAQGHAALVARVALADLGSWVQIKRDLEGLREVRSLSVDAMSRGSASVLITYDGELADLSAALAGIGLALVEERDGWHLRPAAETGGVPTGGAPTGGAATPVIVTPIAQ